MTCCCVVHVQAHQARFHDGVNAGMRAAERGAGELGMETSETNETYSHPSMLHPKPSSPQPSS